MRGRFEQKSRPEEHQDASAAPQHRAYREAQLGSGIVEGRLHLLAYAMGAAASGMTFADIELADVVGEPIDGLLLTCVGMPEYRSATAGPPGAPVEVAKVTERTS